MSGNKGKQWEEQQKAAKAAAEKAKQQRGTINTGGSDFAAKRASLAGLQQRAPGAAATVQKQQHVGGTPSARFDEKKEPPKSSISAAEVAAKLSQKPTDVEAARARALKSRQEYEQRLAEEQSAGGATKATTTKGGSTSPTQPTTNSSPRGAGVGVFDPKSVQLRQTTPNKSTAATAQPAKPVVSKTGFKPVTPSSPTGNQNKKKPW